MPWAKGRRQTAAPPRDPLSSLKQPQFYDSVDQELRQTQQHGLCLFLGVQEGTQQGTGEGWVTLGWGLESPGGSFTHVSDACSDRKTGCLFLGVRHGSLNVAELLTQ